MRTPKIICLSSSLVHFQAIDHCFGYILNLNWLPICILALDSVQSSIEHLHVKVKSCVNLLIKVKVVISPARPDYSHIWKSFLDLLLSYPFSSQVLGRRVGICSCMRNVDEALDPWGVGNTLSNVPRNKYI